MKAIEAKSADKHLSSEEENSLTLSDLGWKLYKNNQFLEAIEAFKKSIDEYEDWQSYLGLGWSLFSTNKFLDAIHFFRKSIALKEDWNSYNGLGSSLYKANQFNQSIAAFSKSIELKETWNSYNGLGWVLYNSKRYADSIRAFKKSGELHENWNTLRGLALGLTKLNKLEEAIGIFTRSLELRKEWSSYNGLGIALIKNNQFLEAIDAFKKAIELEEDMSCFHGIGISLIKLGRYSEAIVFLSKALSIQETYDSYFALGSAFQKQELYLKALVAYRKAWAMNNDEALLCEVYICITNLFPNDLFQLKILDQIFRTFLMSHDYSDLRDKTSEAFQDLFHLINNRSLNPIFLWLYSAKLTSRSKLFCLKDYNQTKHKFHLLEHSINESSFKLKAFSDKGAVILSFGDSHSDIFSCNPSITHLRVGSGTAYNLNNDSSSSGTRIKILSRLKLYLASKTYIILTFGEIDLRAHVYKQSSIQNKLPELVVNDVVSNYMEFIDELMSLGFKVLVNGPHCGGGIRQSSSSEEERNYICEYLNRELMRETEFRKIPFATLYDLVVDPISRRNIREFYFDDNHLYPPTTPIGKQLQSILINRLFENQTLFCDTTKSFVDKSSFIDPRIDKKIIKGDSLSIACRVLASNIPILSQYDSFETGTFFSLSIPFISNDPYHALIELPFPILLKNISLVFSSNDSCKFPISLCSAIYQGCDISLCPNEYIFNSEVHHSRRIASSKIEIIHDFTQFQFVNKHSRHFFLSISNASYLSLEMISIARSEAFR